VDPNNLNPANFNLFLEICAWDYACFREGKVVVGGFHCVDVWTPTNCNVVFVLKDVWVWRDKLNLERYFEGYCFCGVFSRGVMEEAVFVKCIAVGVVLYQLLHKKTYLRPTWYT
jgi:hypothetical protein